ncbi:MAG: hypoxanthine phosphoribosyltransferase [Syntrophobacteraceae bacterium]
MSLLSDPNIVEILIPRDEIARRVAEMGRELAARYADSPPLLVGVLKGSAVFVADLIREMDIPLELDFIAVASYGVSEQKRSSGAVRITKDLDTVIEGKDVLVIEGIVDTGMTVSYILRNLEVRHPRTLQLCTFLNKPARRILKVPIAYQGFEIPDRFAVGYGLDFRQRYRNLPAIGVMSGDATGLGRWA